MFASLNDYLYERSEQDYDALIWLAISGFQCAIERFLHAWANVCWESRCWSCSKPHKIGNQVRGQATYMLEHPICFAAINDHSSIVKLLIDQGVNIDYKDRDGRSPLALAARAGHFPLVQMLVTRGASLLSYDRFGKRPTGNTASQSHYEIED
jgi:hypothetical protein